MAATGISGGLERDACLASWQGGRGEKGRGHCERGLRGGKGEGDRSRGARLLCTEVEIPSYEKDLKEWIARATGAFGLQVNSGAQDASGAVASRIGWVSDS